MRLICPSCATEYEVDAAAIGDRGRMVRCANCDAEWFQAPAAGDIAAPPPPPPPPPSSPERTVERTVSGVPEPEVTVSEDPEARPPPVYANPEPVIRKPRAREELRGASPPVRTSADNIERIYYDAEPAAAPRFEETDVLEETRVRRRKDGTREDLAASLRELDDDEPPRTGGAFLAGFSTIAVMAVVLIALYVKAPDLAKLAPDFEGPLAGYTEMVNKGRFALAAATQ